MPPTLSTVAGVCLKGTPLFFQRGKKLRFESRRGVLCVQSWLCMGEGL
jgi:hypothetical protein